MQKRDNIYSIGMKDTVPVVKVRPGRMFSKGTKVYTLMPNKGEKPNLQGKWIIADFVSGLILTSYDGTIDDAPLAVTDEIVDLLYKTYSSRDYVQDWGETKRDRMIRFSVLISNQMRADGRKLLVALMQEQARQAFGDGLTSKEEALLFN